MPRRALVAAGLAVLTSLAGGLPAWIAPTAAASCSSWTSETDAPTTIRVFRHLTGVVDTVDFQTYTKNVLSREWIGSWTSESLRSGALAVKLYAWYQVLHWRGGLNTDGACFDLRDDTNDQVYDPSKPTWSTAVSAVDATWATRVLKNGSIFPTYYNAGAAIEACGANANGWKLWQWGTQGCGLAGKSAAEIMLTYYYPGVTVTDAPVASGTPAPSATPSPTATPTPTPVPTVVPTATSLATPNATATPKPSPPATPSPSPTLIPTPVPSPHPTPVPTASPLTTPPSGQQLLGGGQTGVEGAVAPPPPPSADPKPVVVKPGNDDPTALGAFDPWELGAVVRSRNPGWFDRAWESVHMWSYHLATEVAGFLTSADAPDPRLAIFRAEWGAAAQRLLTALASGFAADGALALRFPPPGS